MRGGILPWLKLHASSGFLGILDPALALVSFSLFELVFPAGL